MLSTLLIASTPYVDKTYVLFEWHKTTKWKWFYFQKKISEITTHMRKKMKNILWIIIDNINAFIIIFVSMCAVHIWPKDWF